MLAAIPWVALALAVAWLVFARRRAAAFAAEADRLRRDLLLAGADAEEKDEKIAYLHSAVELALQGKLDRGQYAAGRLFRDIDGAAAARLAAEREYLFVLDVRTPAEHAARHVKGCTLRPIETLERRFDDLPRDRPLLVYCAAGGRSAAAADFLTKQGYGEVYNLLGGIGAWQGETEKGA